MLPEFWYLETNNADFSFQGPEFRRMNLGILESSHKHIHLP